MTVVASSLSQPLLSATAEWAPPRLGIVTWQTSATPLLPRPDLPLAWDSHNNQVEAVDFTPTDGGIAYLDFSTQTGAPASVLRLTGTGANTTLVSAGSVPLGVSLSRDGQYAAVGSFGTASCGLNVIEVVSHSQSCILNQAFTTNPYGGPPDYSTYLDPSQIPAGYTAITDDHQRLAYLPITEPRGFCLPSALYVVNRDGSGQHLVDPSASPCSPPDWSPDGNSLLYVHLGGFSPDALISSGVLEVVNRLTGSQHAIASISGPYEGRAVWSHDGSRIAYAGSCGGKVSICLVNSDGSAPQAVSPAAMTDCAVWLGDWAPDDREFAINVFGPQGAQCATGTGMYTINIDGTQLHAVPNTTEPCSILGCEALRWLPGEVKDVLAIQSSNGQWRNVSLATEPRLSDGVAAYDPVRQELVLFGHRIDVAAPAETWLFDGKTWRQASTPTVPSPRTEASMAWDTRTGKVVLFGGINTRTGAELGDTWVWSGSSWAQLTPPGPVPAPRYNAALTEKTGRAGLLLAGGVGATAALNDTWSFVDGAWHALPATFLPIGRYIGVTETNDDVPMLLGFDAGGSWQQRAWVPPNNSEPNMYPGDWAVLKSLTQPRSLLGAVATATDIRVVDFQARLWIGLLSGPGTAGCYDGNFATADPPVDSEPDAEYCATATQLAGYALTPPCYGPNSPCHNATAGYAASHAPLQQIFFTTGHVTDPCPEDWAPGPNGPMPTDRTVGMWLMFADPSGQISYLRSSDFSCLDPTQTTSFDVTTAPGGLTQSDFVILQACLTLYNTNQHASIGQHIFDSGAGTVVGFTSEIGFPGNFYAADYLSNAWALGFWNAFGDGMDVYAAADFGVEQTRLANNGDPAGTDSVEILHQPNAPLYLAPPA